MTREIQCSEVLELLSDFVDGHLDDDDQESLAAHLETCQHCSQFGAQFQKMFGGLRAQLGRADEPDAALVAKVIKSS